MAGEKNLQNYFRKTAKAAGCLWYKIKAEGVNGMPDVMLAYRGRLVFVELKNPSGKGRVSMSQMMRHNELAYHDLDVRVLSTKGEVDVLVSEITQTVEE